MTFLYDARYSIVLLRPKIRSNLLPKVQTSGFVLSVGEIACTKWGELFSPRCRGPFHTGIQLLKQ